MNRKKFKWNVVIADAETTETKEAVVENYWSPNRDSVFKDGTASAVANAHAAEHTIRTGKKFIPVSAALATA
jgi:hypothetical protein